VQCAGLDEALAWAARIPTAVTGSVEVRPVIDTSPGPVAVAADLGSATGSATV